MPNHVVIARKLLAKEGEERGDVTPSVRHDLDFDFSLLEACGRQVQSFGLLLGIRAQQQIATRLVRGECVEKRTDLVRIVEMRLDRRAQLECLRRRRLGGGWLYHRVQPRPLGVTLADEIGKWVDV